MSPEPKLYPVICFHHEDISRDNLGICRHCGRQVQYRDLYHETTTIVDRGHPERANRVRPSYCIKPPPPIAWVTAEGYFELFKEKPDEQASAVLPEPPPAVVHKDVLPNAARFNSRDEQTTRTKVLGIDAETRPPRDPPPSHPHLAATLAKLPAALPKQVQEKQEAEIMPGNTPKADPPQRAKRKYELKHPPGFDYETLRAQIVEDAQQMGAVAPAMKKAGIKSGSTISKLIARWPELQLIKRPHKGGRKKQPARLTKRAEMRPQLDMTDPPRLEKKEYTPTMHHFPSFEEMKTESERLKWMDVFAQVKVAEELRESTFGGMMMAHQDGKRKEVVASK